MTPSVRAEPEPEHLDVVVVGAGLSGIGAAYRLGEACPWASCAVLEARGDLGGTWDLFRYPGIRSDSDMHTLGYPFRPWTGEDSIADGGAILQYLRDTAAEAGIDRKIRFHHRLLRADWSTDEARWRLTVERSDPATGEVEPVTLTCGFLLSCTGYYRYDHGHQPEFPGIDRYRGRFVHPQHWPDDLDHAGARVVVIGSGATAVTLVPSMAQTAAHVTMLQRSPTYIASVPRRSPLARTLRRALPPRAAATATRWSHALGTQGMYQLSRRRPELMRRVLRKGVEVQLPRDYDVDTHFTPRYDPWDQRLCAVPDGDLFEAIRDGRVSVVTDHVDTFTERGIRLRSGDELEADIVVSATGLELLFLGGVSLTVDGAPVDVSERLTYKGMMLEDVPNLAVAVGYTNASWTLKSDLTSQAVCRLLTKMREAGLRQCTPRNHDAAVSAEPMLGLTAGYVQRAVDRFPRQGTAFPWKVHQSYLADYRAMKLRGDDDGAMVLSNPRPGAEVAAITGAGSGIGRALAEELARRGSHLALCDIDEVGLAETVARCEGLGVKVTSQRLDVADREAVHAWADRVVDEHGRVDLVINNAGVALGATVEGMDYDDLQWVIDIDFYGVVHGTKAFLPHLEAGGGGHIVNISSVFGLLSIPSQSAYNAAKFAVRGFTDALRMELEIAGSPVSATTVHPGGIKTDIVRNGRFDASAVTLTGGVEALRDEFDRTAKTTPERAARQILRAVERNRRRALIGPDAKVIDLVSRLPAGVVQRIMVAGAKARR